MGYRSDVVVVVSKELMPHFLAVLAKQPELVPMVFKDSDEVNKDYDGEETMLIHWTDVKWYESYPEVDALNRFFDDCEGDDIEGVEEPWEHFRFIRLGEDATDMVEKGCLHACDIGFSRSLTF